MDPVRILADLVQLPSINPMGRDLPPELIHESRVTAYLEKLFTSHGLRCLRSMALPGRENIVAFLDPPGPASSTILFEAHQDTVPIDGMTIDPFGGRVEGGKLFGRGACDVKGGMASMLAAFLRLHQKKKSGMPQVVMACTVDEEHGFHGIQKIAGSSWVREKDPKSIWAVIAEPTQLRIVNAHKGAVRWDLITRGKSCHSSTPHLGENAIYRMGALVPVVEAYAKKLAQGPRHPRLGSASLSMGMIKGGTSVNTVPDSCTAQFDRRLLPGEAPLAAVEDFRSYLHSSCPGDWFEVTEPWLAAPALGDEHSAELVQGLGDCLRKVLGQSVVEAVPYGTDAATLGDLGIPAVVFGPGNIAQAHTKDEWIETDQLYKAMEILILLVEGKSLN
ncbi:MAG: M20 family peptidase [Gemmataceae bacterium]|nr:M20 family peptidase [Gemmataceae bacterium]